MKLIPTEDYLLFIDEKAEITLNSYFIDIKDSPLKQVWFWQSHIPTNQKITPSFRKAIAYSPLTKEAKELDLPELPPFEEIDVERLARQHGNLYINQREKELGYLSFCEGYKATQANKQFSLEDMKKAIELTVSLFLEESLKASMLRIDKLYKIQDYIIQSLLANRLPKEFIPDYENIEAVDDLWEFQDDDSLPKRKLKTITNSDGKKVLVGTYKYQKYENTKHIRK